MTQNLGILAAIIGAILLGAYFAPIKFSKLSVNQYLLIQFIFATLVILGLLIYSKDLFGFHLRELGFPVLSGLLFAIALALVFFSIRVLGIGKAAAIYIGLQLVTASLIGFAFFHELDALSFMQKLKTIIGFVLVLAGVVLISIAKL